MARGPISCPQSLLGSPIVTSRAALQQVRVTWMVAVSLSEDGVSVHLRVMA